MTSFEIKAIRFCCGYNTDLRVKLTGAPCYNQKVKSFLSENLFQIFSSSELNSWKIYNGGDLEQIEKFITAKSHSICEGVVSE